MTFKGIISQLGEIEKIMHLLSGSAVGVGFYAVEQLQVRCSGPISICLGTKQASEWLPWGEGGGFQDLTDVVKGKPAWLLRGQVSNVRRVGCPDLPQDVIIRLCVPAGRSMSRSFAKSSGMSFSVSSTRAMFEKCVTLKPDCWLVAFFYFIFFTHNFGGHSG